MTSSPIWTEAALAYLRSAWPAGVLTATQIARELSDLVGMPVTKNAVLGKCWRLGIVRQAIARPKKSVKVAKEAPKPLTPSAFEECGSTNALPSALRVATDNALAPIVSPVPQTVEPALNQRRCPVAAVKGSEAIAVHPRGKWPLVALKSRQCRFACTPHEAEKHLFCGDRAQPGLPYCTAHARIAYRPDLTQFGKRRA